MLFGHLQTQFKQADSLMQKSTKSYASLFGKIALGVVIFLVLLPEILRLILVNVVSDYGVGTLEVEDIDLNLFKGTIGIEKINLSQNEAEKLALNEARIDISWLKLLLGEFHIENLEIDGLRFAVTELDDGRWEVVVPLPVAKEEDSANKDVQEINLQEILSKDYPKLLIRKASVTQVDVKLNSTIASGDLNIDQLTISNLSSWQDSAAEVELQANWQQAPINMAIQLNPWKDEPEVETKLTIKALALTDFKPIPEEKLLGKVSTDSEILLKLLPEGIAITFNSNLGLEKLEAGFKHLALNSENLSLSSSGDLLLSSDAKSLLSMKTAADVSMGSLQLRESQQDLELLSWATLTLQEFSIDEAMKASFESLELKDLAIISGDKTQGGLITQQLGIQKMAWRDQHLVINKVLVGGGRYDVVLNKQGQLTLQNIVAGVMAGFESGEAEASKATAPANTTEENIPLDKAKDNEAVREDATTQATETGDHDNKNEQVPVQISIEKILVSEDTAIKFIDLRFEKPVEQLLVIEQLELDNLDQKHPNNDTLIKLTGRIGEFGSINVSGKLKPFAKNISGQISGELDAIELPGISPYSEAYLGYHFSRGHYDHSFEVSIANEEVDVKNTLKIRQLLVNPVDSKEPQPLEKQLDVPLGLALNMLRDNDDNIELKVPVKGRLDQPDIDISQVINRALATALKSGATSYLKYALQPYGAVLMAADFIGEQIDAVRLEPLSFDAGDETVPENAEYIDKLYGLLQDRPSLHLTLCGRSNDSDQQALLALQQPDVASDVEIIENPEDSAVMESDKKEAAAQQISKADLIQLADQRAKNLKRVFIEKGIKSNRLLLCKSEFKGDGSSGVALQM